MVIQEFQPDDQELARAIAAGAEMADVNRLRDDFFVCAVRFRVAGLDMFAFYGSQPDSPVPWLRLPLLDRAFGPLVALDEAWAGSVVESDPYETGSQMTWRRIVDEIEIASPFGLWLDGPNGPRMPVARATYDELRASILAFGAAARAWILTGLPGLRHHPDAGEWFRGEVEVPCCYR